MQIHISTADGVPIYLQIVNQVKFLVAAGRLTPGDELPPIRVLAERLVVNPNTVARAYRELEQAGVVEKLVVYPEAMARNLAMLGGLHNSQRVMLALTQAGVSREDTYRLVQRNAMAVWQSPPPREKTALLDGLRVDKDVTSKLDAKALEACFDDAAHFARVDEIFARVFG